MADRLADKRRQWWLALPLLAALCLVLTAPGHRAWSRFFSSLRIARPDAVTVIVPAFSGPGGSRRLQDAVASMLTDTVHLDGARSDSVVADVDAASRAAGFTPALPRGAAAPRSLSVTSGRSVALTVDRSELQTILREAGRPDLPLPSSVDGARLQIDTPTGVRSEFGHCPDNQRPSLADQIAQRPPQSTDSGDCVILEQHPVVEVTVPPGLDMEQLTGIALEVAGMSPNQERDFQQIFPWPAALALTVPRFMRSYEVVQLDAGPAMLINTAGRRGPTYELLWMKSGSVYTLVGYGSSRDAVQLAETIQ